MSKTNFDDIELTTPGIEAGEINAESATAGQVLTADGAGGAGWRDGGAVLMRMVHDTEDTLNSGSWLVLTRLVAEIDGEGFALDEVTGEITIGTALDGKVLHYDLMVGIGVASQPGYYTVVLRRHDGSMWRNVRQTTAPVSTTDANPVRVTGYSKLVAGEKYRVRVILNTTPAGSADFDLNNAEFGMVAL